MIVTNLDLQTMGCTVCREVIEIPRKMLRDQHALLEMTDEVIHDHRECTADSNNPQLAAANRAFRKRVQIELRRSAA